MSVLADLYAAQPFWIWLAVGVLLLAVEAMFSTEWLLWPAVAAGIVAGLGKNDRCFWDCERYRLNPRVYEWVRAAFETGVDPSIPEP